jgi:hypothetical protein
VTIGWPEADRTTAISESAAKTVDHLRIEKLLQDGGLCHTAEPPLRGQG